MGTLGFDADVVPQLALKQSGARKSLSGKVRAGIARFWVRETSEPWATHEHCRDTSIVLEMSSEMLAGSVASDPQKI